MCTQEKSSGDRCAGKAKGYGWMAAVNQYGDACVCVWESSAAKGACFVQYSNENHELALVFNPYSSTDILA